MKTISLKVADTILKDMDEKLEKHRFSTRTEFIREAIREKLDQLEQSHFEAELRQYFRQHKQAPTENHDVFKELERRFSDAV